MQTTAQPSQAKTQYTVEVVEGDYPRQFCMHPLVAKSIARGQASYDIAYLAALRLGRELLQQGNVSLTVLVSQRGEAQQGAIDGFEEAGMPFVLHYRSSSHSTTIVIRDKDRDRFADILARRSAS